MFVSAGLALMVVARVQSLNMVIVEVKLIVQGWPVAGLMLLLTVPVTVRVYTPRSAFEMPEVNIVSIVTDPAV